MVSNPILSSAGNSCCPPSPTVRTSPHQICTRAAGELHLSLAEVLPPTALLLSTLLQQVQEVGTSTAPPCRATHSMLPSPSLQLYRCSLRQNNPVPLCLIRFWFKSRYEISYLKRKGQIQISILKQNTDREFYALDKIPFAGPVPSLSQKYCIRFILNCQIKKSKKRTAF